MSFIMPTESTIRKSYAGEAFRRGGTAVAVVLLLGLQATVSFAQNGAEPEVSVDDTPALPEVDISGWRCRFCSS